MSNLFSFPTPDQKWEGNLNDYLAAIKEHPEADAVYQIPTRPCPSCRYVTTVPMTLRQFLTFFYLPKSERPNIQNIFPDFTTQDRERLMTGYCDDCWTGMFKGAKEHHSDRR